ncbi:MAG: hypothetical protein ABEI98_11870 [Halorhabdus sp.]
MSTDPTQFQTSTTNRTRTTDQSPVPARDRPAADDPPEAPSVFSPIDRASIPDMFETEAEYTER